MSDGAIHGRVYATIANVLTALPPSAVIGIDIPIGLAESGERECDAMARQFLKPFRAASIFSAPLRCVLDATTHAEASDRRFAREGKRMSIQAYNILPKVREVDDALRSAAAPRRVHEVHPEISFAQMNAGVPLEHSKKSSGGRAARLALLRKHFGDEPERLLAEIRRSEAVADDVLDALAVLWTARRLCEGVALRLPADPPLDPTGLPMAIHY